MDEFPELENIRRQLVNNLLTVPYPLIDDLDKYYFEDKYMKDERVYVNGKRVDNCRIVYANSKVSITYDEDKFDFWDIVDNQIENLKYELAKKFNDELYSTICFKRFYYDIPDDTDMIHSVSFIITDEPMNFNRYFIADVLNIPLKNILCHKWDDEWVYTIILEKLEED